MAIKISGTTVIDDSRNISNIVSANLGAVGDLTVTGGSSGQILSTDGSGGLSFTSNAPTATSATSATTAGTVTTAAQPSITSVGSLTGLTVNGQFNLKELNETAVGLGNTGTAKTIDLTQGTVFTATLTGNCTFTISNPNTVSSFILILLNDGTAGRSVAFSGGTFKYPGGSVTRTTTANKTDIWFFTTPDTGTTYYGSIPMANM